MNPYVLKHSRAHRKWSHRFAFFWLVLALVVFGGAYALAEIGDMSESSRTLMFVMLGAIIVTNAIWQAAGLALCPP